MTVTDLPPTTQDAWVEHIVGKRLSDHQYTCSRCKSALFAEPWTPIGAGIYQQGATWTETVPTQALRCDWKPPNRKRQPR